MGVYNQSMIYCPNCGAIIEETDVLCMNCGANLAAAKTPGAEPGLSQSIPQPSEQLAVPQQPVQLVSQQSNPSVPPPGYRYPVQPAPVYFMQPPPERHPNYLITKILIFVGVLVSVFFFFPFIKVNAFLQSGYGIFRLGLSLFSFSTQVRGFGYLGSFASIASWIVILAGVLLVLFASIPVAGSLTLLSLFNLRIGVRLVKTFATIAFSGMLAYFVTALVAQTLVNQVSQFKDLMSRAGIHLEVELLGVAFWVCFVGMLVLIIGTSIDLRLNRSRRR
jgi:hypothetical protein